MGTMADEKTKELALDTALRLVELNPRCHPCNELVDEVLLTADRVLEWLQQDQAAELILIVGPVTEQT